MTKNKTFPLNQNQVCALQAMIFMWQLVGYAINSMSAKQLKHFPRDGLQH